MGEKIKTWLFENIIICFCWGVLVGLMKWIDNQKWEYIHGHFIVLLLVSYWLKNTLFKKKMDEENYRLLSYQEAEGLIKLHKDWVTRTPVHGGGEVYKVRVTLWHYEDGSTDFNSISKKIIDDKFEYLLNG